MIILYSRQYIKVFSHNGEPDGKNQGFYLLKYYIKLLWEQKTCLLPKMRYF